MLPNLEKTDTEKFKIIAPRKFGAMRGWYWINEGFRYFLPSKHIWMLSLFLVVTVILATRFLFPALQIVLIFCIPFIVAGLSIACYEIEQGKPMSIKYLIKGFSLPNKVNIFRYGLLVLFMMILAQLLSSIFLTFYGISQEQLASEISFLQENTNVSFEVILESEVLYIFFVTSIVSVLPILMINIFAPIILAFSNMTAFQATKLSFIAALRNISAIIVYAVIYILMLVVIIFISNLSASLLFSIFGESSLVATFTYFVIFLSLLLTLLSISYSSAYVAFKDIFVKGEN